MSKERPNSPKSVSKSFQITTEPTRAKVEHVFSQKLSKPENMSRSQVIESPSRKKNGSVIPGDSFTTIEKTSKIKKNKKKKRKGMAGIQSKKQKITRQDFCESASTQPELDMTPVNDAYGSESEDAFDEDNIDSLVDSIVQEHLERYYDQIQKKLKHWLKEMDRQPGKTFVDLMAQLSNIFEDFETDLYEEIQFEDGSTEILDSYWDDITRQFKTYVITRFPLLKDFIENFPLGQLDEAQTLALDNLKAVSILTRAIMAHIEDIQAKKAKKKNKRKKKKQKKEIKKRIEEEKKYKKQQVIEQAEEIISHDFEAIITRLNHMKIDERRDPCAIDGWWLERICTKYKYPATKFNGS